MKLLIFIGSLLFISFHNPNMCRKMSADKSMLDSIRYQILPVNESVKDASLVKFIGKLRACVAKKDTLALFSMIDTSVVISYGGMQLGKGSLKSAWKLEKPAISPLWSFLQTIINLGGAFEDNTTYCIPRAQSNKITEQLKIDLMPYFTVFCILPQVKVFDKPDLSSKVIGYLHYELVKTDLEFQNKNFQKISTFDNRIHGFIKNTDVFSSASPKLILKKNKKDVWKITSFAPFD